VPAAWRPASTALGAQTKGDAMTRSIPTCAGAAAALLAASLLASAAAAAETVYRYDARGRLIAVERSGGHTASYSYDKADNRVARTVAGAVAAVAVVPVPGGYRIIPIEQ
jgi:YD repeat-containing protein